jgi:CheY-like chemotaxis protein
MYRVCFIDDDSQFEIPLFHDVFADVFDIVSATSYAEIKSQISNRESWQPNLFVLDLYFPSGLPDQDAIEALKTEPLTIENDNGEIRPASRNYLKAGNHLQRVLDAHKQGPTGGLELAKKVAVDYPDVPIVFYSRKATIEDVIRCLAAENVWAVERKPTGRNEAETIELTKSAKDRLVRRFERAILKADADTIKRKKAAAKIMIEVLVEFDKQAK